MASAKGSVFFRIFVSTAIILLSQQLIEHHRSFPIVEIDSERFFVITLDGLLKSPTPALRCIS
jgi:hypothetical protein